MLILTRRVGEEIVIGSDIKVVVVGVKGSQVRIGVKAPKDVPVNREEIHERILAGIPKVNKMLAASTPPKASDL